MKGLLLLSGGIDSPVAGWVMKKHMDVVAVHFSFVPLTDDTAEQKSRVLADQLGFPLHVIPIAREIKTIGSKGGKLYFVLMKRLMLRRAAALAKEQGCQVLITGENIGQVSSQTLQNLAVIDEAVSIPVLRPLIARDKQDIIAIAKVIDTLETSTGKELCDVLGPQYPATGARLQDVQEAERLIDLN